MTSQDKKEPDRIVALTEIWREALGNPALDENSDLFKNGGSSLHVLQITGRIHDVLGIDVKLRHVFSHTSPRGLSDFLESELRNQLTPGGE
ncbi:acyl carrier protein [Streptomyces sp. NPDC057445]|uniref:acyl carrier protein n=1 Tax=Streptomyces sp. NPDC057445 TaxID=3346136 RepID=UPI0036A03645